MGDGFEGIGMDFVEPTSSDEDDDDFNVEEEEGLLAMSQSDQEEEDLLDEELDAEEELRELERERREEERRALGGWDDESAMAHELERQQEIPNNPKSRVSVVVKAWPNKITDGLEPPRDSETNAEYVSTAHGASNMANCGWLDEASKKSGKERLKERKGVARTGHVKQQKHAAVECWDAKSDVGNLSLSKPIPSPSTNLPPAFESDVASQIDLVGTKEGSLLSAALSSRGIIESEHASNAILAHPLGAFSSKEDGLLDLYAAQPLHSHPTLEPGTPRSKQIGGPTPSDIPRMTTTLSIPAPITPTSDSQPKKHHPSQRPIR